MGFAFRAFGIRDLKGRGLDEKFQPKLQPLHPKHLTLRPLCPQVLDSVTDIENPRRAGHVAKKCKKAKQNGSRFRRLHSEGLLVLKTQLCGHSDC